MATKNLLVRGVVVQSGESVDKKTGEIMNYTHVHEKSADVKYDSVVYRVEGIKLPEGKEVVLELEHVAGVGKNGPYAFTRFKNDFTSSMAGNGHADKKQAVPAGK